MDRRPWFGEIVQDVLDPTMDALRSLTLEDISQRVADLLCQKYETLDTDFYVVVRAAHQYALKHALAEPDETSLEWTKDEILSSVKSIVELLGEEDWLREES